MIRLTVQDGKFVKTLALSQDRIFVGRMPGNHLHLDHPSVSRKHCMIRRTGAGGLELLDLNSRHGVRVNGTARERASLSVGDEVAVGEVLIRVEDADGPVTAPPPKVEKPGLLRRVLGLAAAGPAPSGPPPASPASGAPRKVLISQAHRKSFSEELFGQVRRTPWWAASVTLHLILVYLMFSVPFDAPAGDEGISSVAGEVSEDLSRFLDESPLSAKEPRDRDDAESPLPEPRVVEKTTVPVEPIAPPDEPEKLLTPEMGPATMDFSTVPSKTSPFAAPSVPDVEFGQDGAEDANQEAGKLLKKSLEGRESRSIGLLSGLQPSQVLVVSGHYDRVETILDMLEIRCEEISVRQLERTDLTDRKILLINCSNERPSRDTQLRIREFVRDGGYLLTTDWGIENVLKVAFEGYLEPVTERGRNVITPNEVIRIHAAKDRKNHFLLAGTSFQSGEAKWWLEESSYPFRVKRPKDVDVLIESNELMREYGTSAVAATFKYGKGRVLHMLGHFFQKEGNLHGTFSTHRLIANFLMSAVRRR